MILEFLWEFWDIFLQKNYQNNLMNRYFKIFMFFISVLSLLLTFIDKTYAESQTSCPNRYVTLVNPVRGRNLWFDTSLKPIVDQYSASAKYNFPTTWLMQYDALTDVELIDKIKSFEIGGEKGLFLEISKNLADNSGVVYPSGIKWSDPGVIFLSAYSQSERRVLIDTLFNKFKKDFGYYPKSVGAWWIDSYSLNYIKEKYGLDAILIVADQKTTDSYGVWGQWWGYPYYPSKENVLIPATNNPLNSVVIQWAQRDPLLAYGEGSIYSNFSLQANDYIRSGKNTNYFKDLIDIYLGCQNSIGQITIGLETGMESVAFNEEYVRQLKTLSEYDDLKVVTMSDFAKGYEKINKVNPAKVAIGSWNLTPAQRQNTTLGDYIKYNQGVAFSDYFVADKSSFLNRDLSISGSKEKTTIFPWLLTTTFILGAFALWKRKPTIWICSALFAFASFGLILRSSVKYGWLVFYGPVVKNIIPLQCLLVLGTFAFFFLVFIKIKLKLKNLNLLMWLLPLSFALDRIMLVFRYSVIDGNQVVGFLVGRTEILGLSIGSKGLELINRNFTITQILAFLKFPFEKIWQNVPVYLTIYPLVHIIFAIFLYFLLIRAPKWVKILVLTSLLIFFVAQLVWIFGVDPLTISAVIN